MKSRIANLVLGFVILAILICALILLFNYLRPETFIALLAGLLPTIIFWKLQIRREKNEHHNWVLRNKEAYLIELVDTLSKTLNSKEDEAKKEKKIFTSLRSFTPALIVWGSPAILTAWNELGRNASKDTNTGIRKAEQLLRTIRNELGHDDSNLRKGEVMSIFIKGDEKDKIIEVCKDWDQD